MPESKISNQGLAPMVRDRSKRSWFHRHPIAAVVLWVATALVLAEGILLVYFFCFDSWLTLPLI